MGKLDELLSGRTVILSRRDLEEMVMKEVYGLPGVDQRRPFAIRIVFDGEKSEAWISLADTLSDQGMDGR